MTIHLRGPRRSAFALSFALAAVLIPAAAASQFVDVLSPGVRVTLRADGNGRAMLYYSKPSGARHVLVSGAINARYPSSSQLQVHFRLDYSGGWRTTRHALWKTFPNSCGAYNGPPLAEVVATCKAPDGSYWAAQEWQVALPDLASRREPSVSARSSRTFRTGGTRSRSSRPTPTGPTRAAFTRSSAVRPTVAARSTVFRARPEVSRPTTSAG